MDLRRKIDGNMYRPKYNHCKHESKTFLMSLRYYFLPTPLTHIGPSALGYHPSYSDSTSSLIQIWDVKIKHDLNNHSYNKLDQEAAD